jgi:hypothetical protein
MPSKSCTIKPNGGQTMRAPNKIKLNQNKKSRIQILRSWMTSFAVTVTAAIVVITTIPASPIGSIEQVQAFENVISYQISVTDEEQALYPDSLKIVLENQFEYYECPINLGSSAGSFDNLNARTQYTMRIVGNKGFGNENLDTVSISTRPLTGATISGYRLIETLEMYYIDYEIDVLIFDPNLIYEQVNLYYAFIYEQEQGQALEYIPVEILEDASTVLLEGVPNFNTTIHVYLEATLLNQEIVRLDEIYIHTPFSIEASLYLDQITDRSAGFTLYQSYIETDDLIYTLELQTNGKTVQTKSFSPAPPDSMHSGLSIEFTQLKPETDYRLAFFATYTNPYTLVKEKIELDLLEWRTLGSFTYTYTIEELQDTYQVDVSLIDPSHNFQILYYYVYEQNEFGEFMVYSGTVGFTPQGDSKTATLTFQKNWNLPYRIEIGFRSQSTFNHYYSFHQIIKE